MFMGQAQVFTSNCLWYVSPGALPVMFAGLTDQRCGGGAVSHSPS